MTGTALLAILLLLAGTFLNVPVAIVLSIVVLLLEVVRAVWARFGLERVTYRRRLERDRMTWGEEIPTAIEVWNRKRMPLAWMRAEDEATGRPFGIECAGATEHEAIDRLNRWIDWQREHAAALEALQAAERAYHRTIAGSAFANPIEGPTALELQKESLDAVEAARILLDEIRARKPD